MFDLVGIGLGPYNLSLNALIQKTAISSIFLESKSCFDWHDGMLLDNGYLQIHFLKDLVSLTDPTSQFSFMNFLHQNGYSYMFLNRKTDTVHRLEFLQYMRWVADKLPNIAFDAELIDIEHHNNTFRCITKNNVYHAKNIVFGTGIYPYIPTSCTHLIGEKFFHNYEFKNKIKNLDLSGKRIAVIGGGQSGAEVVDYLLTVANIQQLMWFSKRINYHALDDSCFSNEFHTPKYVEYFYNIFNGSDKQYLLNNQILTSDGITQNFADSIYNKMYHLQYVKHSEIKIDLFPGYKLVAAKQTDAEYELGVVDNVRELNKSVQADIVILATGYKPYTPKCLKNLLSSDPETLNLNFNYSIDTKQLGNSKLFIQNISRSRHGVSDPNLSLTSHRNAIIINAILGHEFYKTTHFKNIINFDH